MKLKFKSLKHLCEQSKKKLNWIEVDEINGLLQIESDQIHPLSNTISIFQTHFKIQREITKSNAAEGYQKLIDNLNELSKEENKLIRQINIITEVSGYMLFTDQDMANLIGCLRMKNQKLDRKTELTEENQPRGTWTKKQFFLQGKELN